MSSASPLVRPAKARLALMTGTLTMSDPNHDAASYAVLEEFEQLVAKELRGRQAIQRPDGSLKVDPTKVNNRCGIGDTFAEEPASDFHLNESAAKRLGVVVAHRLKELVGDDSISSSALPVDLATL